jgi:hypothetical protein
MKKKKKKNRLTPSEAARMTITDSPRVKFAWRGFNFTHNGLQTLIFAWKADALPLFLSAFFVAKGSAFGLQLP